MAEKVKFQPQTFDINSVNGGNRYKNGDGVNADSINSAIEASAYAQALATNPPDTTNANNVGNPSVSIETMPDGSPRFRFENLKGEEGSKIVSVYYIGKDENGGNIYEQVFNNGVVSRFIAPKGEMGVVIGRMEKPIGTIGAFYPAIIGSNDFSYNAITPTRGTIYLDVLTNIIYNWSGTSYDVQAEFQEKYDDTLETDDKTVAGAINEINNKKQGKIYEHNYLWRVETSALAGASFETRISFLSQKSSVDPTVESLRNYLYTNGYTGYTTYKPCNGFIATILDNVCGIYSDGEKVYVTGTKEGSFLTKLELVSLISLVRNVKELS